MNESMVMLDGRRDIRRLTGFDSVDGLARITSLRWLILSLSNSTSQHSIPGESETDYIPNPNIQ